METIYKLRVEIYVYEMEIIIIIICIHSTPLYSTLSRCLASNLAICKTTQNNVKVKTIQCDIIVLAQQCWLCKWRVGVA